MSTARAFDDASLGLVDTIKNYFSAEQTASLSQSIGESVPNTVNALTAIVPAVLGGVVRMGSSEEGAEKLLGLIRSPGVSSEFPDRTTPFAGQNFLSEIFGNKLLPLGQTLSRSTGVGADTIQRLLGRVAPIVLTALAAKTANSSPSSLMNFLGQQKGAIEQAMPPGLSGGLQKTISGFTSVAGGIDPADRTGATPNPGSSWLGPALVIGLLAVGAYLLFGRLPGRVETSAITSSNQQLKEMLAVGTVAVPYRVPFPELVFESGSTRLTPAAAVAVVQLSETMRVNPTMQIRVDGHTDDAGDVGTNERVSLERAQTIKSGLEEKGISGERIGTLGRGATEPVATNLTDEGRAANRRIEVVVLTK